MNGLTKKRIGDLTIFEDIESNIVKGTFRGIAITVKKIKNTNEEAIKLLKKLTNCHHPNVQRVFKFEVDRDSHYLALELCSTNLTDFIRNSKENAKKTKIIPILNDITKGLKYLHDSGILHKNLNPKNILVVDKKSAKLCNVGIESNNLEKVNKNIYETFHTNLDLFYRFIYRLKYTQTQIVNIQENLTFFHLDASSTWPSLIILILLMLH